MNNFKAPHWEEPNEPPIYCNSKPPSSHFKYRTYTPKTSPVVSDITGILNHHAIDNGDVEVHPSEFPVESNYEYVTDSDTTMIKSIDDLKMDNLL